MKSFFGSLWQQRPALSKQALQQGGLNTLPKDLLRIFAITANAKVIHSLTKTSRTVSLACLAPHFKRNLQESHTTYRKTVGQQPGVHEGSTREANYIGQGPNRYIVYHQQWIVSGPYQGTVTKFFRITDYDKNISVEEAFYNNGSPYTRYFTRNNKFDGLFLRWFMMQDPPEELPVLAYRVRYVDGYREGVEEEFYGSGQIAKITHWVRGVREGPQITYTIDGQVIKQCIYRNGCPLN